jgi:mono/diheme cytochrome c family protein
MATVSRRNIVAASLVVGLCALGVGGYLWSGAYDVGADEPHWRTTYALLETVRNRSIEARANRLDVPADLSDPARIRQGAGNYAAMCAGCHLAPGVGATEMSKGLYPTPPNLARTPVGAAEAFWAIKHGIKASGMPAWGKSMDDAYIWNLAAFLQLLPKLDPAQYEALVANSAGHSHGGGETMPHDHDGGADHHSTNTGESAPHSHEPGGATHEDAAKPGPSAPHSHASGMPPHQDSAPAAAPSHTRAPGTAPHTHGTSGQRSTGTSTPPVEPVAGQQDPHHDHDHEH